MAPPKRSVVVQATAPALKPSPAQSAASQKVQSMLQKEQQKQPGGGGAASAGGATGVGATLCFQYGTTGACQYGKQCKHRHDTPEQTERHRAETASSPTCAEFCKLRDSKQQFCNRGAFCHGSHPDIRELQAVCCALCKARPYEGHDWTTSLARPTRLAVLLNCDHAFCLACMEDYVREQPAETKEDVIKAVFGSAAERAAAKHCAKPTCPVCAVPVDCFIMGFQPLLGDHRVAAVRREIARMAKTACKHYRVGHFGSCTRGAECWFAHKDRDGGDAKPEEAAVEAGLREQRARDALGWRFTAASVGPSMC
jgi:hypothetical protein